MWNLIRLSALMVGLSIITSGCITRSLWREWRNEGVIYMPVEAVEDVAVDADDRLHLKVRFENGDRGSQESNALDLAAHDSTLAVDRGTAYPSQSARPAIFVPGVHAKGELTEEHRSSVEAVRDRSGIVASVRKEEHYDAVAVIDTARQPDDSLFESVDKMVWRCVTRLGTQRVDTGPGLGSFLRAVAFTPFTLVGDLLLWPMPFYGYDG